MTRDEFEYGLEFYGFSKQRFSEYNNDAFENTGYVFGEKRLHIEVFVDYYNIRIVWWHEKGKKVSKCYYVKKDLSIYNDAKRFIDDFLISMMSTYGKMASFSTGTTNF